MPEYLSPGVYVEEFDSGSPALADVSTSTAGFLGVAQKGPTAGLPQLVTSFADFQRQYGSYLSENACGPYRFLAYAVDHFFQNGGSRAYIMRVAPGDAKMATNATPDKSVLHIQAANPGAWGNQIRVRVTPASKAKTQIKAIIGDPDTSKKYQVKSCAGFNPGDRVIFVGDNGLQYNQVVTSQDDIIEMAEPFDGGKAVIDTNLLPQKVLKTAEFTLEIYFGDEAETFSNLSLNGAASNHVDKVLTRSNIIAVQDVSAGGAMTSSTPFQAISGLDDDEGMYEIELSGGSDGTVDQLTTEFIGADHGPGKRTGIAAFVDNDEVSIIAAPGITDPNVQLSLVAHCENLKSRFAILDIPVEKTKVQDVESHRNIFDTSYAALYHPWLQVFDPLERRNVFLPPSGSMAGIYARSDNSQGVHKAPANEVVRRTVGLSVQYNKGEQDILNPKGVNLIRYFTGQGIRVWGARTASSNSLWKYVNVRRLFIFLEESIKRGTNWVVFEPNDERLWARVHRTIDGFLTGVWRNGALEGSTPAEAFYIRIGRDTMLQDDIDNGRLICIIGVAPVKPAEFVIFRITQKTREQ
ncbi:phage tail sheath family protein [Heliobacterium gestii]|uniref:Phage tail sheath family protein n=1 Tax=Heliomicrobium gestii TaxID=2699 RepID=A0A845LIU0_HELGE|nr:phage tail sheath subtilisin-like domain-containing protein [Heliomicrobium gestii]MBM7868049.1 phage tail sheath protein FI [Heliomicrobium gestii]MZP44315.1 phage tail sheath family protein [Heliomicrobium gestii]